MLVPRQAPAAEPTTESKPQNIVMILVDDLSWSDLGCFGNEIHDTPNIDRLADTGVRFTQAYAPAPICSASRAAILTGKFPARLQFEFVTKNTAGFQPLKQPLRTPAYPLNLSLEEQTMAEALTTAGLQTGFFGKWHVNQHYQGYLGWSPTHGPLQQGFAVGDSDFGAHPYGYRNDKQLRNQPVPSGEYPGDALTTKAVDFIEANAERPFFLYLSHYFVHDPVHSRCEWLVDKYQARLAKQGPPSRAGYGAMVETLDHLVGRVLDSLDRQRISEHTMVVLMSDNGGHPNHTTNAPLRGSKWNLYEGGIRVPLIVRWPAVASRDDLAGTTCDQVVHGCDLMPTFCEVAGVNAASASIDGTSLCGVLRNPKAALPRPQSLIWHFPFYHPEKKFAKAVSEIGVGDFVTSQTRPHSAMRRGKWKLLKFYEDERLELYDLSSDIAESRDLAESHRDVANDLNSQLEDALSSMDARLPERRLPKQGLLKQTPETR